MWRVAYPKSCPWQVVVSASSGPGASLQPLPYTVSAGLLAGLQLLLVPRPSARLQGEFVQSNIWKPGPASARESNQSGEVLVERLDSALGHVAVGPRASPRCRSGASQRRAPGEHERRREQLAASVSHQAS